MFSLVILGVLITCVLCTVLSVLLWPYRRSTVHGFLLVTQIIHALWAFLVLSIFVTDDFETRVLLTRMRQLILPTVVSMGIVTIVMVFYRSFWERYKRYFVLLFIIPAITILGNMASILGFSFAEHLVFYNFQEFPGCKGLLSYSLGPLISINFIHGSLGILLLNIIYIHNVFCAKGLRRKYAIYFLMGSMFSTTLDLWGMYLSPNPVAKQVSVGGFWVFCLIIYFAVTRLEFLDIKSLAQERVFENLPNPVVTLSPHGELWDANRAARELFFLKPSDQGRPLKNIPELCKLSRDPGNLTVQNKVHQVFHYELAIQGGESHASVYVLNNISDIVQLNKDLEESNLVLKHLTDFNKRIHSVLSHDMSGSLGSVHTLLTGMHQMKVDSAEYKTYVDRLVDASSASLALLQNVLAWNKEDKETKRISLKPVVESSIRQLSAQVISKNIQIESSFPEGDVYVSGSKSILEAIFRNVLSNAIKFSHAEGKVQVTCHNRDHWVEILVQDWGVGMTPEAVERLISGTNQEREVHEGYGVGMHFTVNFIKEIKGHLHIESEISKGTRVHLRLPAEVLV
nr:ATP-binding protein [uncultured Bdellovibrio sp.]